MKQIYSSMKRPAAIGMILALMLLSLSACIGRAPASPKYVFLFIGDGMGLSHICAAQQLLRARAETTGDAAKNLAFTEFPVLGIAATSCTDRLVTDSAAAVTALASGRKTSYGRINIDPTGKIQYPLLTDAVRASGQKIGIISTVPLNHATPAGFYAHALKRGQHHDIAMAIADSGVDFFGGGALLDPKGRRGDRPDALAAAESKGYSLVSTLEELHALQPGAGKVIAINQALTSKSAMPYVIDGPGDGASLAEYVETAVRLLENDKGFFIMTEGGKIDWACHDNDAASAILDVIAFDEAIREARKFQARHPDDTLIVVTADHETGGLALNSDEARGRLAAVLLDRQHISQQEFMERHVFPYRGATALDNWNLAALLPLIEEYFGLARLTPDRQQALRRDAESGDEEAKTLRSLALSTAEYQRLQEAFLDPDKSSFGETITRILNEKAGFTWTTESHTAISVPVFAIGAGQSVFAGSYDNTDIPRKLAALLHVTIDWPDPEKRF